MTIRYIKKGEIVYFIQTEDEKKPEIKCYNLYDFTRLSEDKKEVGYGKLSITKDNIVHLWGGKVDMKHLKKYIGKIKNRNLEIVVN